MQHFCSCGTEVLVWLHLAASDQLFQTHELLFHMWCLQGQYRKAALFLAPYLNINRGKAHSKHMSDIQHKPTGQRGPWGTQARGTYTSTDRTAARANLTNQSKFD